MRTLSQQCRWTITLLQLSSNSFISWLISSISLNVSFNWANSSFTVTSFWWEYSKTSISLDFLMILDTRFVLFLSRISFLYSLPLSVIFLWCLSILPASSGWAAHASNCFKTSFAWFDCPSTNWLLCPLKETWWLPVICSSLWQSSLSLRFSILILRSWSWLDTTSFPSNSISLLDIFTQLIAAPYTTNVTALNRGTSIYLTNLLGMFDVLTQQEIAKVKPYIY